MAESTATTLDSLPDKILRKIVLLAAKQVEEEKGEWGTCNYLVDDISRVSTRFKEIAFDP